MTKKIMIFACGVVLVSGIMVAGLLWALNKKASSGAESYLKQFVFKEAESAQFESFHMDLFRGLFSMEKLALHFPVPPITQAGFFAEEISVRSPIQNLLAGRGVIQFLKIDEPKVSFFFYADQPGPAARSPFSGNAPPWVYQLPLQKLSILDGHVLLKNNRAVGQVEISSIDGTFVRLVEEETGVESIKASFKGQILSEEPGEFLIDFDIRKPTRPMDFEGEIRFKGLSIPYLSQLFPRDPEVSIISGEIDLKTQVACNRDWLTASHLVEVKNLKIDVAPTRRKLMGLPVKDLKNVLETEYLSFIIPMNGNIGDPHVGMASSFEQILYKFLEERFKNKRTLANWARYGGEELEKKVNKAIRKWLK